MTHAHRTPLNRKGFTIVELMIATTVLSVILVIVTVTMISIGNLYYKGINTARIQDNVRNTTDEISQQLQLSVLPPETPLVNPVGVTAGALSANIYAYCIGTTRYSYILNQQIGSDTTKNQVPHVLWRDSTPAGGCTQNYGLLNAALTGGAELVAPNSRLTNFSVSLSSPYSLTISEAYGDSDLLHLAGINTTCNGLTGDQFCSTAFLTTIVVQRITGSP